MLQPEATTDNVPSASTAGPCAPVLRVVFSFPAGSLSGAAEQAGGMSACLSLGGSAGVQAASAPLLSCSAALGIAGSCPLPSPWLARGPWTSSFTVFPTHSAFGLGSGGCSSSLGPSFSSTLPSASWAPLPSPLTAVSSTCNQKGEDDPEKLCKLFQAPSEAGRTFSPCPAGRAQEGHAKSSFQLRASL